MISGRQKKQKKNNTPEGHLNDRKEHVSYNEYLPHPQQKEGYSHSNSSSMGEGHGVRENSLTILIFILQVLADGLER